MGRLFAGTAFDIPPTCDRCGNVETDCRCDPAAKRAAEQRQEVEAKRLPPQKQTARVGTENRKGGRKVTVVRGLSSIESDLPDLLSQLRIACGGGGTLRSPEDVIEIQGQHIEAVGQKLRNLGYRVK